MKKSDRLRVLLRLVPTALSLSSVATHAMAIDAPGNTMVAQLSSAMHAGYLNDAQKIADFMLECGVRAIVIGDTTIQLDQLDAVITDLAKGDKTSWSTVEAAFQSVETGALATFLSDRLNIDACVSDAFQQYQQTFSNSNFGQSSH